MNTLIAVFDNYYVNTFKNKKWYLHRDNYLFKKVKYGHDLGYIYLHYSSPEQLKLYNSEFFGEVYSNIKKRIKNESNTKMYLYSAHDTNLLAVLVGLNLTNWKCLYNQFYDIPNQYYCLDLPSYASNL